MKYAIREIIKNDNLPIEKIIRDCLIEYHANHNGTAWADSNLNKFSEIYNDKYNKYWVALVNNQVVGGVGIGKLTDNICELQKMYCIPRVRGTGIAQNLLNTALAYASKCYKQCYL
jgi:putative acetyltransferase